MVFSSVTFLFYFLPCLLLAYFILPNPKGSLILKNIVLFVASLVFYAWGEPKYIILMLTQCVFTWFMALLISKYRHIGKLLMIVSIMLNLSSLIFFKYTDFFIKNINGVFSSEIPLLNLALPVGISFYTFKILSYTIDVYKEKVTAEKNVLKFSIYLIMFFQILSGPIERYSDMSEELTYRKASLPDFALGVRRFVFGLAKKVLLADIFGGLISIYKSSSESSVLFVWLYLVAYSLYVYFDFSGYSDMAVGLGLMLGFKIPENFNYPYIARTITDFFRRWHMTLGSWFRDYIYIPLGGNRVPISRHLVNTMIIWMLTGFWHGANWNYILWGAYLGIFMLIEKYFLIKPLEKIPKIFSHIYLILMLFISWQFFDGTSITDIIFRIGQMFGIGTKSFIGAESIYYLRSYLVPLVAGLVGVTPLPKTILSRFADRKIMWILEPIVLALLIIVSTAFIVDGSFNPFIYFNF